MRATADPDTVADALLVFAYDPAARSMPFFDPASHFDLFARLALGKPVAFVRPDLRRAAECGALRAAALSFIARTQFASDADYYTLLGVTPAASMQTIRERHRLLMQIVHPDRASRDVRWPEGIAARVNRAYGTLKDAQLRAAYDARPRGPAFTGGPQRVRATTVPVVGRPLPRRLRSPLPEWMTAGVGGFFRRNPATVIFAMLISVCSLAIATVALVDQGTRLHRGRGRDVAPPPAAQPVAAAAPVAAPAMEPVPPPVPAAQPVAAAVPPADVPLAARKPSASRAQPAPTAAAP